VAASVAQTERTKAGSTVHRAAVGRAARREHSMAGSWVVSLVLSWAELSASTKAEMMAEMMAVRKVSCWAAWMAGRRAGCLAEMRARRSAATRVFLKAAHWVSM